MVREDGQASPKFADANECDIYLFSTTEFLLEIFYVKRF
jgi:hypothetical protein